MENNPTEIAKNLIRTGFLTDKSFAQFKEEIAVEQAEENRKRELGKEQHRREQAIKNRPENKYAELWNLRKVYPTELDDYLNSYNLKELENYADALQNGRCQSTDFKNGSAFEAWGFLNMAITRRKSQTTQPQQNKGVSK